MKPVIKESPVKTRRKFDEAFKREAVQNWISSGKTATQVARELGLSEGLLFTWRKILTPAVAGGERPRGAGGPESVISRPSSISPTVRSATCASSATF